MSPARLNFEAAGDGPALLLLHGFTGSAATWHPFREAWSGYGRIAVDLPGHGASELPGNRSPHDVEDVIDEIVALLDALEAHRLSVLGYSMGGRLALHLARRLGAGPMGRIEALILESASPGISEPEARAARRASDLELAARIERDGITRFVDAWERLPLFASQARMPLEARRALREQRLGQSPRGLANALRALGAGSVEPAFEWLPEIRCPVLLVAGALDEKYRELARTLGRALGSARVEIVPDAGHAIHLERPATFARLVRDFLDASVERRGANP